MPIAISEESEIAAIGEEGELPFHCVSTMKLTLLSLATIGLYQIFWFYKNWALVKARSGRNIRPFWRAVFSPFFCHSFASEVNSVADSAHAEQKLNPEIIAVIYAGLILAQGLPDPYWLIGWFSFVPLIPIAWQIRRVHETIRPGFESTIGWGGWSYAILAVGIIPAGVAVIGMLGPPTRALRQSEIPSSYRETLVEAGVLEPDEQIQFFYSGGLFSILEDGNLLTEDRVIGYETVGGELYVASATYPEIREFEVEVSESFVSDTILTIATLNGDEIMIFVSAEDGRDKEFVSYLQSRIPPPQPDEKLTDN